MAVREGFEPSIEFPLYTLSRRAPSATRTSHRFEDFIQKLGAKYIHFPANRQAFSAKMTTTA